MYHYTYTGKATIGLHRPDKGDHDIKSIDAHAVAGTERVLNPRVTSRGTTVTLRAARQSMCGHPASRRLRRIMQEILFQQFNCWRSKSGRAPTAPNRRSFSGPADAGKGRKKKVGESGVPRMPMPASAGTQEKRVDGDSSPAAQGEILTPEDSSSSAPVEDGGWCDCGLSATAHQRGMVFDCPHPNPSRTCRDYKSSHARDTSGLLGGDTYIHPAKLVSPLPLAEVPRERTYVVERAPPPVPCLILPSTVKIWSYGNLPYPESLDFIYEVEQSTDTHCHVHGSHELCGFRRKLSQELVDRIRRLVTNADGANDFLRSSSDPCGHEHECECVEGPFWLHPAFRTMRRYKNQLAHEIVESRYRPRPELPASSLPYTPPNFPSLNSVKWDVNLERPTAFVRAARFVHASRKRVERRGPVPEGPAPELDTELQSQRTNLAVAYRQFAYCIGITSHPSFSFDKKESDRAFRECFGVHGEQGTGVYRVKGMDQPLLLPDDAGKIFSLYLGRKGFICHDPRQMGSATAGFIRDVTTPRPQLSPDLAIRKARMLSFIKRLARVHFAVKPGHSPRMPLPNSGRACLEKSRSRGGKREALYCSSIDETARHFVQPTSILTAGKVRPITIASVYQERYSWLNSYCFNRLRKFTAMIAGRESDDWAADVAPSELPPGHVFVSGDLKSATTLFSGDFANAVVDELAVAVGLSSSEVAEIKGGLTSAQLVEKGVDTEGNPTWEFLGHQVSGQNLGADLSFPILCMITYVIGCETHGVIPSLMALSDKKFYFKTLELDLFGVNGDDFITWGKEGEVSKEWMEAVKATSGEPEPTKSPVNSQYWTVNSTLYRFKERIPFLSPALCLNLCESYKVPQASWLRQFEFPSLDSTRLGVGHFLFGDVPCQIGGLGISPTVYGGSYDEGWVRRYLYAAHRFGSSVTEWIDREDPVGMVKEGTDGGCILSVREREPAPSVVVTGVVSKSWLKGYAQRTYMLRDILHWSRKKRDTRSHKEIMKIIRREREVKIVRGRRVDNILSPFVFQEQSHFLDHLDQAGLVLLQEKRMFEDVTVIQKTGIYGPDFMKKVVLG